MKPLTREQLPARRRSEVTTVEASNEKNIKLLQEFAQRLIYAQENERKRISQEMHDDLGNRIALLGISVRHILKQKGTNSVSASREFAKIFEQIEDLGTAVREISHGLHPILLRHAGIAVALKSLQETLEGSHDIRVEVVVARELPQLEDDVSLCVFRIAQEALQNVIRHSGAKRVSLKLARLPDGIRLAVSDTGRGFVLCEATSKNGLGLQSMETRALAVGGRLAVNSSPGVGTEVCLTIPLKQDPKNRSLE